MQTWVNTTLGQNGWGYWCSIFLFIFPFIAFYVLGTLIVEAGWEYLVRMAFLIGILFTLYVVALAVMGLNTASRTAKKILITSAAIEVTTFSGRKIKIDLTQPWQMENCLMTKKYHHFMFQPDRQHLFIRDTRHSCYISAHTTDFDGLTEQLTALQKSFYDRRKKSTHLGAGRCHDGAGQSSPPA